MRLRIKELRKAKKLTGEQLGDIVGISKGYVSELETGSKTPGAALLVRLADALRVDVADLFDGTDDERNSASLAAHMSVMAQLSQEDRVAIERAALGLLAKQSVSNDK